VGLNALAVYYDANGDGKTDYTGRIVYRGGLFVRIPGKGKAFESVPVSRPTPSSASLTHPVDVLFPEGTVAEEAASGCREPVSQARPCPEQGLAHGDVRPAAGFDLTGERVFV
jgi:hypothetical protein